MFNNTIIVLFTDHTSLITYLIFESVLGLIKRSTISSFFIPNNPFSPLPDTPTDSEPCMAAALTLNSSIKTCCSLLFNPCVKRE